MSTYEDWYATGFGALADELELDLLDRLLRGLPRGSSILEVGCGTGHFGAALGARGYEVSGVDLAGAMLQRARTRFPVALADAAQLPFAGASFDAVVLIAVLDFVPDPLAVLREAQRVARGNVVVLALVSHSLLAVRRRVSARRGHAIFSTARFYSRRRLLGDARRALAPDCDMRVAETHQILVLPPSIAGRLPALERWLSRRDLPCGGILGFRLEAGSGPQIDDVS